MLKWFKRISNAVFLTLSCFLVCYFLIQLTENPYIRAGICLFAVSLDIFMQYVLATGRAAWKGRWPQKVKAVFLFFCYACYVAAYAVPSAVGFFIAEIDLTEAAAVTAVTGQETVKTRLKQIDATIKNLNLQMETEAVTGFGERSKAIIAEIKELTAEQKVLMDNLRSTPAQKINLTKDVFASLGAVLRVPGNSLKIIIFGVSVLMLYLGLILTAWDVTEGEPAVTPGIFSVCPVCNEAFPPRNGKVFCSNKCKQAAYRDNKMKEVNGNG
ncbi:MAG: hypothetical protein ACM3WV_12415 [Bacillota bacterium]